MEIDWSLFISIITLIILVVSNYLTHFRKAKLFGRIFGFRFLYKTDINLLHNINEEYKNYQGYGYQILVSLVSHYADFSIKKYSISVIEGDNKIFLQTMPYFISMQDVTKFKYDSISKISLLEKDSAVMCILQFMIEGDQKVNINDFDLREVKLSLWDFKNNRKDIHIKIQDVDLKNIIPDFIDDDVNSLPTDIE